MERLFTPLLKDPANLPAPLMVCTTAVLLVIPLILLLLLRRASASSKRIKLPPGPRGLPLIGHLHVLLGHNFYRFLSTLSRTHGPLVFLRVGCVPVVVASTPTMAQQILQAHDQTFSSRPPHALPVQLGNCESMVFSQPGPYWKLLRQLFSTNLFAPRRFASFQPLITDEVHGLLRSILKKADQVPLRVELVAATGNIVWRMAVGKKLADLAASSLPTVLAEYVRMLAAFNVGDFAPWLAWMDLQGRVQESRAVAQKLHKIWQEVIDGRREARCQSDKPNAEEEDNFLDVLIAASDRRCDVPAITDSNIMAILTEIFTAGIDSSAVSTEWAFSELLTNPIKLKKLQDELDRVVGTSRLVQASDIPHLPYLQAVVKELMRLHPTAPLLLPHKASQACTVAGYDIPAGTVVYVNAWAIGRDPEIWERPLEFSPERFLERDTDVRGQHFELLPFGSGRRACPGMILGLFNVQYMLASMVHCFDWSLVAEPDMSERFSLVLTLEKPLLAKATPRLPMHLFEI